MKVRCLDESVEKAKVMCGWECRERKGRCVDGSVEREKGDEWMGV